jgi:hypothetical protein
MAHTIPGSRGDARKAAPDGYCSFELAVGPARLQLLDLPTTWDAFVTPRYGAFAVPPGAAPDLAVRCREAAGERLPLPPPGESTVLEVEATGPRTFRLRSHWHEAHVDVAAGTGELTLTSRRLDRLEMSVENFLRVAAQLLLVERGAFLLHAAGVLDDARALLFFGPSGAGKSTAFAFSDPRPALSDDMVVVDVSGADGALASTVPFFMKFPPERRERGAWPVAGAFRLRQAPEDRIERLSPARAVASLSASVPYVHELGLPDERLTSLVARACGAFPVSDLHFTRSGRFWSAIGAGLA